MKEAREMVKCAMGFKTYCPACFMLWYNLFFSPFYLLLAYYVRRREGERAQEKFI
jgi:hypothetical protein